ncbi:MAG: MauE/DoxX family redox-associated membrane protein [Candidatus Omnitrophota bacterium]
MKNKIIQLLSSPVFQVICRLMIGGMFIYAGIPKVADPHGFAKIMENYKLLPSVLITLPSLILPWVEIIAGLFLILGIFKRTSAIILTLLLGVFIVAISLNLIRGISFDCGCFSTVTSKEGSNPVGLLIRDALLLIPTLAVVFFTKEKQKAN